MIGIVGLRHAFFPSRGGMGCHTTEAEVETGCEDTRHRGGGGFSEPLHGVRWSARQNKISLSVLKADRTPGASKRYTPDRDAHRVLNIANRCILLSCLYR